MRVTNKDGKRVVKLDSHEMRKLRGALDVCNDLRKLSEDAAVQQAAVGVVNVMDKLLCQLSPAPASTSPANEASEK